MSSRPDPHAAASDTLSNAPTLAGDPALASAPTLASDARAVPDAVDPFDALDTVAARGVSVPHPVDAGAPALDEAGFAERYELRRVLGEGGMGEVKLCKDKRIGREVALKVARSWSAQSADARARFLREARVQGQLEHPSVVPVYDLGQGADGAAYFTMKRVRGLTLEQVLEGLDDGAPGYASRYSRRKLLTAFASLCLAIDFAHARGVLHRDLKPANVMLGDFGEVHVLDWGLAKIAGVQDPRPDEAIDASQESGGGKTLHGQLMGTPGYMAPEQARGQIDRLDARTDVYSLGAILFELLAGRPLHPQPTVQGRLVATVEGRDDARPSVRAPERELPPELDAICVQATALDPAARFAGARALSDAVERYLDGDRDVQRRRELAGELAASAVALAEGARAEGAPGREARARAMREVTRALALDPEQPDALRTLAQLLTELPAELPPEAEAELAASAADARRNAARMSAVRYLTWIAFMPAVAWMGARDWTVGLVTAASLLASALLAFVLWRKGRTDVASGFGLLALSSVALGLVSSLFGPFILVPSLVATNTMFFAMHADRGVRRVIAAVGVAAVALPFALDLAGLVPPAYSFTGDGTMVVHPRMAYLPGARTLVVLLASSIALVVTPTVLVGRIRDALSAAERRLFAHAWHLRQMVPDEARSNVPSPRASGQPAPPRGA